MDNYTRLAVGAAVVAGIIGVYAIASQRRRTPPVSAGRGAGDNVQTKAAEDHVEEEGPAEGGVASSPGVMNFVSWNIAAVNNNPFEYWIAHPDPAYNQLMRDVQAFINQPGDRDVAVCDVFTDAMFAELVVDMEALGWEGVPETVLRWKDDFRERKIITGFLLDKALGKKRLASMPDRVLNTINAVDGQHYRPTIINCYEEDLGTVERWWAKWKEFVFSSRIELKKGMSTRPCDMLQPILQAKYPDVTEEEERICFPLQTLALAIFDAVLVHMVNTVSPDWQPIKKSLTLALNQNKIPRTMQILGQGYGQSDVFFLQEVAGAFEKMMPETLAQRFHVAAPAAMDSKRNQNSIILLNKRTFTGEWTEITEKVTEDLKLAQGDLLAVTAISTSGQAFLLASFHGDTDGLCTIPVLKALHAVWAAQYADHMFVFGLDANTYAKVCKGKQDIAGFTKCFRELGLTSNWGDSPDPDNHTCFNARTYLQAQFNKACDHEDIDAGGSKVDKNPKDFILFPAASKCVSFGKDNTGRKDWHSGVFPSLEFPSDHALVCATVKLRASKI